MPINKIKKILRRPFSQTDTATIKIGDVVLSMARQVSNSVPHEFSVYVPRVEIRQRYYQDNQLKYEKEMILNSLTIVHAPQHPPAESGRLFGPCQKMD
ncbi:hypothetical protein [Desulfallas thermosapovorans]|uniref:Uncharacterized protein n=1 Tax=Desulfallas thermosapovorans DSM 6562 TaxID=1121431 RepID=A0A5S4ZX22_9FIRM|nr:hypothetical protein [Desulfallas thermosapovorans]TYO97369.1 hypothetical protein LX24_00563 [Desulfallas thermosapovorans DSM 6562]